MPDSLTSPVTAEKLVADYGQAWNDHSVDDLLSMQTDDMTFQLHLEGSEPVTGREALRGLYSFFFTAMPDYRAEINSVEVREDLAVLQYVIEATLATEFPVGDVVGTPTGQKARVSAMDVLRISGGRVARKDTYVDGFALRRAFGMP
ncbi:MAG TPA: nuclear transport factor 2 family protein [Micromonosporaceae bacterium]|nr:nuclear transport factor 2 family protein [Micromonosporaceae bacterium]